VSLWLDTYEDIFSDFDPHPYGRRALSEDFLAEARRAVRDRRDEVPELRLLVPTRIRSLEDETIIRKRLRDHFEIEDVLRPHPHDQPPVLAARPAAHIEAETGILSARDDAPATGTFFTRPTVCVDSPRVRPHAPTDLFDVADVTDTTA
jgi:hypothetical protein